jgi:branched-chain amino acid transport system substrate-binding protein
MNRRQFVSMLAAASSTSLVSPNRAFAVPGGPIKVGLMAPLTGVAAGNGKEAVEGFNLYFAEKGKTIAGREIEILVEDDASNPNTALQKARRLVEESKADFLIGNVLANTGIAVAEYASTSGVPYFIPIIAADDLTQRKRIPNVIRVAGFAASQLSRPLADYAYKKRNFRKVVTIAQDYTFGHEQCGGFAQTFSQLGGEIPLQLWNPLNTADFGPYLAQIQALKPDAVFASELGADGNRFLKQWSAFGLKDSIALLGAVNLTDQAVIRTLGAEAEGVITSAHYAEGNDAPATKAFVETYLKAYDRLPSLMSFSFYSAAIWLAEAIKKVDGKVEDRPAFLKAVREVVLTDSPLGRPVHLDEYGNPIYDIFIREVKRRPDGRLWNVPIEVYPNVSQFGDVAPETYMKQPPYSRGFQGVKKS